MSQKRKYYIGDDEQAAELVERIFAKRKEFLANVDVIREQTGASAVMIRDNHRFSSIAFDDDKPRKNILDYMRHADPDLKRDIFIARFDKRTKLYRDTQKLLDRLSIKRSPSDEILDFYGAHRHAIHGRNMLVSVGHPLPDKKRLVVSVPVDSEDAFEPNNGLREIAKSEYVYLTEEYKAGEPA